MIFNNPIKDFFCRAVMHAKHQRIRELGTIEAEIIVIEEGIMHMQKHKADDPRLIAMTQGLEVMKELVRQKKKNIL